MEAFRVLPPLAVEPPPPPAPRSPRVAPRFVQQKESSAFVVLAEVGGGPPAPSSPFRGRGFRGSASSRIPVKSAPSSPGPRAPKPLVGKSAPSSPSKPAPAKRLGPAKQPPSLRKPVTKPTPRPRFVQKTQPKDDQARATVKKAAADNDNKPTKLSNENNCRVSSDKKLNENTDQIATTSNDKEGRKVRQLNNTNSFSKGTSEKPSVVTGANENNIRISSNNKLNEKTDQVATTSNDKEWRKVRQLNNTNTFLKGTAEKSSVVTGANENNFRVSNNKKLNEKTDQMARTSNDKEWRKVRQLNNTNTFLKGTSEKPSVVSGASLPTSRGGKAAVERAAVIMDRVNRLRPERQMISSTMTVKRNNSRTRLEAVDANSQVEKNGNNATSSDFPRNGKKAPNSESKSANSDVIQGKDEMETISSGGVPSTTDGNYMNPENDGITLSINGEKETETMDSQGENKTKSTIVDVKSPEQSSENARSNQKESSTTFATTHFPHDSVLDSSAINSKLTNSASMNLITTTVNSAHDVEDSSSTSQSSSQLTLVTGTTKVNIEPMKDKSVSDMPSLPEVKTTISQDIPVNESNGKNVEETINSSRKEKALIKTDVMSEVTPNGVLPIKTEAILIPNGGESLQNKIIIMQSDKNGSVKVIGSEPVSLDIEEAIRESIVTETAVPSEELLVRRQPDLIPSAQVEEPAVTVIGQPDLEVQAGNHSVSFRFPRGHGSMENGLRPPETAEVMFNNGKFSPEIHPVSARPDKRKNLKELCGCCRPSKRSKLCSWRLPWFKKRNGPGPPPPPKVKKKRLTMPSLFSCCKCKKKPKESKPPEPKVTSEHITPSEAAPPPTSQQQAQAKDRRNLCRKIFCCGCKKKKVTNTLEPPKATAPKKRSYWRKVFCCCCSKSSVRPRPQQSQELLKNRRKEMSKSRTTSIQSGFSKLEHSLVEHSSMMRGAIPVLPICLAWTCLILNVFLPGTGTMTSGMLCLCFGKPRFSVNDTAFARFGAFCINLFIGIGQIFTIIFCLVGWGWSIWWGVIMLRMARKHRRIKMAEKASQPQTSNQNQDVERGH